jgi:hypothetical protein
MPSTILGGIIFQLEGGAAGAPQGPGVVNLSGGGVENFVNEAFGQHAGFANEYGSGETGVLNYAQQMLAANPNATVGQFYASYNQGTGNPANITSLSTLASANPGAYNNFTQNAGQYANTPLASVIGNGTASGLGSGTYSTGLGSYEDIPSEDASGGTTDLSGFSTGVNGATGGNQWVATTNPDGSVSYTDQGQTLDWSNLPDNAFDNSTVAPAITSGAAATAATPATAAAGGAGGIAVNLTDETQLPSSVSGAGTAAKAGLTTAGSDVQTAAGGLAGTAASIVNSAEAYTSKAIVVIALVLMGAIFVALGLGLFGKRELAAITP